MRLKQRKRQKRIIKNRKKQLSYKLLKTSWNVQTKEFFKHSTLHGVRYIAEEGRPFIERFMWFVCVMVGGVATIVIIMSLWEKFQTNPTITGLDTDFHNWKVPFPAIIVCEETPSNDSNIESYLSEIEGLDPDIINNTDVMEYLTAFTKLTFNTIPEFIKLNDNYGAIKKDEDLKTLAFHLMNKCEDVFDSCVWKSNNYNCCDGFFPVFTESGFCFAFNSKHYEKMIPGSDKPLPEFEQKYIKETDLKWSIKFSVKKTNIMPIYILNSDEMAGIDVQPQHIWDYRVNTISFSVKQTYTTEDTRQLSIKQRHCAFDKEIPLQFDKGYTYTTCTIQCRMNTAVELCKCIPHFYPLTSGNRHCKINELKCIAENIRAIRSVDKCGCVLGCLNTVYEVEKLNENPDNAEPALEAEFVSWPMLRYKREVLFGWVDLLVSFGGIAGLFLGFSLLSGVEIIYYFTLRACCMVVREKDELEKIEREEALKPPTEYDLSLMPYFLADPLPGNGINEIIESHQNEYPYENVHFIQVKAKKQLDEGIIPPFGIEFVN